MHRRHSTNLLFFSAIEFECYRCLERPVIDNLMNVWEAPRLASEFVYPGYYPRIVISRFKLLAPCVIDARAVGWDRGSKRDRGVSYFQRWVRRVRNSIAALRVRPRPLPVSDTIRSAERPLAPTPPKGHGSALSETDHPYDRWSRRVESNDRLATPSTRRPM